ncbi:transcriptional repressor LexA [Acidobacteriota bacterium]
MVNKLRRELTERQREILEAIQNFILQNGYSPTIRQLGSLVRIDNPSAVFKHVLSLEKKGYINRADGDLNLTEFGFPSETSNQVKVPLVGLVPAGHPKEVFELYSEALDIPDWMVGRKRGNIFCIHVDGKSMVDAYIDDGDRVLVERAKTASSGEMVVALLDDGSVTLKRLKLENGRVWLIPENPEFQPIPVENLRILGKVIGVLRKY